MTSRTIDDLISDLGADLRPVRRLGAPWLRAFGWVGVVAALAACFAAVTDVPAIVARLTAATDMWMAVLASVLTMIFAAIAAFELSYPDRSAAWALLPLPALALWLGESGLGCLRPAAMPGLNPPDADQMRVCFGVIVGLSIPLSLLMIMMIRRACPLRPNLTAATAGLAAAAASATLLTFFHEHDAGATDLLVHFVAVTMVVVANRIAGGRLLSTSRPVPARAVSAR